MAYEVVGRSDELLALAAFVEDVPGTVRRCSSRGFTSKGPGRPLEPVEQGPPAVVRSVTLTMARTPRSAGPPWPAARGTAPFPCATYGFSTTIQAPGNDMVTILFRNTVEPAVRPVKDRCLDQGGDPILLGVTRTGPVREAIVLQRRGLAVTRQRGTLRWSWCALTAANITLTTWPPSD